MTPTQFLDLVGNLGTTGLLLLAVYAFLAGKVVSPREVRDRDEQIKRLVGERDELLGVVLKAVNVSERVVRVAENGEARR